MEERRFADRVDLEDRHWWYVGRRTIFLRMLDRYLPPAPTGERTILDVGCGSGTMLDPLGRYGAAQGVEADEALVRLCHARGLNQVTQASVPPLPFESDRFDLVTVLDVLEHVEGDRAVVREVARVLRPDGMLLLAVPAFQLLWSVHDELSEHKRRYRARQIGALLRDAGLEVGRLTYFNTLLFPPAALVRLTRRVPGRTTRRELDCEMTKPGRANAMLTRVFSSEARLLDRVDFPVGLSILAIAFKPGGGDALGDRG